MMLTGEHSRDLSENRHRTRSTDVTARCDEIVHHIWQPLQWNRHFGEEEEEEKEEARSSSVSEVENVLS